MQDLDAGSRRPLYRRDAKIGVVALVALIFFSVSGGPFGFEEAVEAAGTGWVLVGCAIMPLLWSVPEALMTAELSAAFPEAVRGASVPHACRS